MAEQQLLTSTAPLFKVEGTLQLELTRDIFRLEIIEDTDGLRTLRATFIGIGPKEGEDEEVDLYLDGEVVDFGKRLEVAIGPQGEEKNVFKGRISAIEQDLSSSGMPLVTLLAEDDLMKLRQSRRSKTYEKVRDADLAQAIASEHGLSAQADVEGPTYDLVQQLNQSDLAFLRERAALIGAEVWVADRALHFKARGARKGAEIKLTYGRELVSVRLRGDLAHQRSKVVVSGYDAKNRDLLEEEAASDAIQSEVSGGRLGPDVLEEALGERVAHLARQNPLTAEEATAFAKAEMRRRCRAFVTAVGETGGTPTLTVGSQLKLEQVGAPFSGGGYYVTRVCHTYDLKQGYRTSFEAERATLNEVS